MNSNKKQKHKITSKKHFIKSISDFSIIGGLSVMVMVSMQGCDNKSNDKSQLNEENRLETYSNNAKQSQNHLVVLKEVEKNKYIIEDEFPSETNAVIIKSLDGKEKLLQNEEIKQEISNANNSSLGTTLGVSILGAAMGYWAINNLMSNQQTRSNYYANPRTMQRGIDWYKQKEEQQSRGGTGYAGGTTNSFNDSNTKSKTSSTTSSKSSGFFSSSSSGSSGAKSSGSIGG